MTPWTPHALFTDSEAFGTHRRQTNTLRAALLLVLGLLLLLVAQGSVAKRVALVIGNGDYQHESDLRNPVNDARLMARTLRGLGFQVEERLNLNRRDMTLALARFADQSSGAATALVYFAGHGMQPSTGGRNFLLPVDANIESDAALRSDAIAADELERQLKDVSNPARVRLVILDACRNNPRAGVTRSTVRGLARMAPSDDYTLIAFSTDEQNVAQDGKGNNSPYAEALSRHLSRARELPLRRIFELTAADVRAATNQSQRPRTYGDLDSLVGLDGVVVSEATHSAPMPAGGSSTPNLLEDAAWALCQNGRSATPCERYLERYGASGKYAALAQTRIEDLQGTVVSGGGGTHSTTTSGTNGTSTAGSAMRAPGDRWKDCANCPELVMLPAGSFVMGSPDSELGHNADEGPPRTVTLSAGLAVGRTAVTRGEFAAFVAATGYQTDAENNEKLRGCLGPSRGATMTGLQSLTSWRNTDFIQDDDHPVVCVSWNDAQQYVAWLNRSSGVTGWRLLTESEYEYAARAGSTTSFAWGNDETGQCAHANGADAATQRKMSRSQTFVACDDAFAFTARVGRFRANGFGLFDMVGNSQSWVQDCYVNNYVSAPNNSSPVEDGACSRRVLRGGGWFAAPQSLRSAYRGRGAPEYRTIDTGFRLARTLP